MDKHEDGKDEMIASEAILITRYGESLLQKLSSFMLEICLSQINLSHSFLVSSRLLFLDNLSHGNLFAGSSVYTAMVTCIFYPLNTSISSNFSSIRPPTKY